jgi:NAD(P)-dependent dehydrogenase (short-subunit alcohol dehydrogenase family)
MSAEMRPIYSLEQYGKMRGVDIEIAAGTQPFANLFDLTGQVAIVTGGARGLGFHVVNRLVEAGAKVMIVDIATEFAEDAVAYFKGKGAGVEWIDCDIRSTAQITQAVEATLAAFGRIDVLVNDAAIMGMSRFVNIQEDDWNDMFDTNVRGAVFFARAVAEHWVEHGIKGKIVNIGSAVTETYATPYFGFQIAYASAKQALIKATQIMARDLHSYGIVVTCVCPGGVRSPGSFLMKRTPDVMADPGHRTPLAMDPDQVARVIFALSTDFAEFATGAIVTVDGGLTLGAHL